MRPGARAVRAAAWALYPILAFGYVAMLFAAPGGMGRFAVLEAIYLAPIVASVVLGAIAARQSAGPERRYWILMSAANALLGWCEVMLLWWLAFISPQGPPPVEWPFQVVHVVAAACFVTLVLSMTRLQSETLTRRARAVLDFSAMGLVVYAAILVFYARPVMEPVHAPIVAILVGSGYVLAACLMTMGTLGNIVGFKMVKWRSWETLTAVAIGIYSIAIAMWPLWYTTVAGNNRNMERGVLDLIQFSGHFLLAMAAVYRLTETDAWDMRPLPLPWIARRHWAASAPTAISVGAIVLLGTGAATSRSDMGWFAVYAGLALMLLVIVLTRSVLLTMEHGRLFIQSVTDPLTGLNNHRYFQDQLGVELDRAARYAEELAVVVVDIDDFGAFNSMHGHLEGDRLLAAMGERLGDLVVGDNVAARLGGDEFGLLLPGYDARSAAIFTQHVLDVIGVECGVEPGGVAASAGVAAYPEHGDDGSQLLHYADGALFHAKDTGKGRVVVYDAARVPDLSARERIERLERQSRISAVQALAAAVDARDADTRFHAARVADLATRLASYLQAPAERIRFIEIAAVVHDVGKIAISDSVLKKTGELTSAEWDEIRSHPEQGQRILAATGLPDLVPVVRSHHERWDGTGYPDGLVGKEIPYEARVVALCDAYEAMTADRAHRPAMTAERAEAELLAGAGVQFDPGLTEDLVGMLASEASAPAASVVPMLEQPKPDVGRVGWIPRRDLGPERF